MRNLGPGKQRGGTIRTRGHAGSAANTGGSIHGPIRCIFADEVRIAVHRIPSGDRDVSPSGNHAIEGAAIDDQVLNERESASAPGLKNQLIALLEVAHGQLANRGGTLRPVRNAVDHKAAGATNPFAAIVLKGYRLLALFDQALVEHVQALQHRHLTTFNVHGIADELARNPGIFLTPDFQRYFHYL